MTRARSTGSRVGGSARSCSRTSSSKPAPDRARPRCSPSGWRLAWRPVSTRSSTWRPSRSRGRPRRSFAAASTWRSRAELARACAASPGRPADLERIARLRSALSNLERFFAGTIHSFCARLLRERPVESGVSPGFTELDEVQDLELRQRVWRDFITNARAAGDPDMMALLAADIRPKDLDSAFATICDNEDVEFPAGEGACPDPKPAWKALETFWKELQKHLPSPIDPDTTCKIQQAASTFRGQLRVSRHRIERPAVVASLLATWDRESKIIQKWWADSAGREEAPG